MILSLFFAVVFVLNIVPSLLLLLAAAAAVAVA